MTFGANETIRFGGKGKVISLPTSSVSLKVEASHGETERKARNKKAERHLDELELRNPNRLSGPPIDHDNRLICLESERYRDSYPL